MLGGLLRLDIDGSWSREVVCIAERGSAWSDTLFNNAFSTNRPTH